MCIGEIRFGGSSRHLSYGVCKEDVLECKSPIVNATKYCTKKLSYLSIAIVILNSEI